MHVMNVTEDQSLICVVLVSNRIALTKRDAVAEGNTNERYQHRGLAFISQEVEDTCRNQAAMKSHKENKLRGAW